MLFTNHFQLKEVGDQKERRYILRLHTILEYSDSYA